MKHVFVLLLTGLLSMALPASSAINGAGSTFAAPLYTKLFEEYAKAGKGQASYESVGSGAGIDRKSVV